MLTRTIILLGISFAANAISMPKYLKPCSRSHNFTECATKSAQYAIPFLIKGDRHLKLAPMNPVRVEFVELSSNNINLKMRNIEVYGLDTVTIVNMTVDFENKSARIISAIAKATILGEYEIKGQIILPITGHGPANITLYNGIYQYDTKWDFSTKNGKRYMNITDSKYDYVVDKITYDFKNLFNGDKVWGEQMNKILNENWKEVNEDLKAPFLETLLLYHNDISIKIFSQIPYDELFLE